MPIYYPTGYTAFAGIATTTSSSFERHDRIWASGDPTKASEVYPFRGEGEGDEALIRAAIEERLLTGADVERGERTVLA